MLVQLSSRVGSVFFEAVMLYLLDFRFISNFFFIHDYFFHIFRYFLTFFIVVEQTLDYEVHVL